MPVNVYAEPGTPQNVLNLVMPLVQQSARLLPVWVANLEVYWRDDEQEALAEVTVSTAYRRMSLKIGPKLLTVNDEERAHTIRHEMMHAYTTPIGEAALEAMKRFFPDGKTPGTEIAEWAIRDRVEAATEDLTLLVEKWS